MLVFRGESWFTIKDPLMKITSEVPITLEIGAQEISKSSSTEHEVPLDTLVDVSGCRFPMVPSNFPYMMFNFGFCLQLANAFWKQTLQILAKEKTPLGHGNATGMEKFRSVGKRSDVGKWVNGGVSCFASAGGKKHIFQAPIDNFTSQWKTGNFFQCITLDKGNFPCRC